MKRLVRGLPLKKVLSSDAMVDQVKKAVKKPKKPASGKDKKPRRSAKKSDKEKGASRKAKSGDKKTGASTKDKIKAKAKQNKKTEGS